MKSPKGKPKPQKGTQKYLNMVKWTDHALAQLHQIYNYIVPDHRSTPNASMTRWCVKQLDSMNFPISTLFTFLD
jgi:hypothetical protein